MFTSEVYAFFPSKQAIADELGITVQAVYQWKTIVPPASAIQLARRYPMEFKLNADLYADWPKQNVPVKREPHEESRC